MKFAWRCALVLGALMAGSLLLGACGGGEETGGVPMFRGNPARTGVNPGPGVERSPTLLWRFETGDYVYSSPAVVGGVVYIDSMDSYVYALDAVTGEEVWRFQTHEYVSPWPDPEMPPREDHCASPAVVDGVVYMGSWDHHVYAVDAATGEELWRFETGYGMDSSPAVVDGVVYIARGDYYLHALDAATGKERWRFETSYDENSSPAVVDGVVYIGSWDHHVYAVDAATGEELWRFETGYGVNSSPAVVDGVVYIGSDDSYVYALDAATGDQRWRFETGGSVISSPAVVDGVVYIGSDDSYVYALDAATGEELWHYETSGDVHSSPAVVDGVVYVGSNDDHVYALDAATGEERWRFETDSGVWSSPAVVDGVVYVGSRDGSVYAITEGEEASLATPTPAATATATPETTPRPKATPTREPTPTPEATPTREPTPSLSIVTSTVAELSVEGPHSVVFSPDGSLLAIGTENGTVILWDVNTHEELRRLEGHTDIVSSVAFSQDGSLMASGSSDGTVVVWDVKSGNLKHRMTEHTNEVTSVDFAPFGTSFISGDEDGKVIMWDAADGGVIATLDTLKENVGVTGVAWSHRGALWAIAYEYGELLVSDWTEPDTRYSLQSHIVREGDTSAYAILELEIDFSPDDSLLAAPALVITASTQGEVFLWDMSNGEVVGRLEARAGAVRSVTFSPDGSLLATGDLGGTVKLWEVETGQKVHTVMDGGEGIVWSLAFHPQGRLLAAAVGDKVWLWEIEVE